MKIIFPSKNSKISLRLVLIIPFILQTIGAVSLVGYLSFQSGREGINNVASQLRSETANRIKDNLDIFTNTPYIIGKMTEADIRSGKLNIDDLKAIEKHLWQLLNLFHYLTFHSYGNEKDEYIGVYRTLDDGVLRLNISHPETKNINHTFNLDNQGNPTTLYSINNKLYPTQRGWYKAAKMNGKPAWYPIYKYTINDSLGIGISLPIYRQNGEFHGVIAVDNDRL